MPTALLLGVSATHTLEAGGHGYLPGALQLSPAGEWRRGRPHCSGQHREHPGEWYGCEQGESRQSVSHTHLQNSRPGPGRQWGQCWRKEDNKWYVSRHSGRYTPQVPPCETATFLWTVRARQSLEGQVTNELWPQAGNYKVMQLPSTLDLTQVTIERSWQWWSLFYIGKSKFKL